MTCERLRKVLFLIAALTWYSEARAQQFSGGARLPYPTADRVDAVDVLHGVTVADPYRWLEDLGSPKTREWIKAQDDLTRRELDGAAYRSYRQRIDRLANVRRYTTPIRRGSRWFFFETDSNGTSGRVLMMRESPTAVPRNLVGAGDHEKANSLSRVLAPSPDGRLVAYGIAVEGSRWLQLRFVDPATGQQSAETLDGLHSSMGAIAWTPDSRSFYYVRFNPPQGPRLTAAVTGAVVMRHALGTPQARDERVFQLTDAATWTYAPAVSDDGHWLIVTSTSGASAHQQVWLRDLRVPSARLRELFPGIQGQFTFLGSLGDRLWFQTSVEAPRQRVVRVDPRRSARDQWQEVVPQPDAMESIAYVNMIAERLIVFSTRDAAPRVRIHTLSGTLEREVPLPPLGTVWGPSASSVGFAGRPSDRDAYYVVTGVSDPGSIYHLDPQTGHTELFLRPSFGFDPKDFVGRQVFYTAKDGTRIPMFIAHHKDVRPDGARAALIYGYGAFGWAAFPWFQPQVLAWMETGGVYAIPCLRGGGEYGDQWHEAAVREKKQTSVDDYIAAGEWLVANKYAAPQKLVANGGSVSGVIAAAAVVQRPTLFGAALIDIPALDMVRYDRHTGAASWIPEFGSVKSPVEFKALRALSPYHNLDSSVCYPPMLVLAGEIDDITVPSHAYKFIAAAQQSQPCAHPALLQVAWGAGHTFGNSNETSAENWARQLAFVSKSLGLDPARPHLTPSVLPEVEVRGRGDTTMVLIPCMSCRWTSWEPFMARNSDRWRMYAVTLPGFGGTRAPELPTDTDEPVWHDNAVEAVSRLLEERDLRDVVLVGHSFGAAIALQVAARNPARVSRLVNVDGGIMSPRTWFPASAGTRAAAARRLTDANAARFADIDAWRRFNTPAMIDAERRAEYHGMFMATPQRVVFQYWRENLLRDLNPLLASLQQPALDLKMISASDPDPARTRAQHLTSMRESNAPASVASVFLYNTGHFVHEERPQLLEDTILAFLENRPTLDATPAVASTVAIRGQFGQVKRFGSGPTPMILMPCLGCDWRAFDEFMTRNAAKYRMYAVTWPGMGHTPLPRTTPALTGTPLLDNIVEALARLIREEKLDKPTLVAHSAAGPVAVRFASEFPDLVGRVITVDATIQNDTTLGFTPAQRLEWAEAEMAKVLRQHDDDEAWRKLNTPTPGSTQNAQRLAMYGEMWLAPPRRHVFAYWQEWLMLDAGTLLTSIKVPTLALFAVRANTVDPDGVRKRITEQFRRNRASSSIVVDFVHPATHSIWETQPDAFDRAIERFVNSATPPMQQTRIPGGSSWTLKQR